MSTLMVSRQSKRKARLKKLFAHNWEYSLMVLPIVLKIILFSILPMIGLIMAFQDFNSIDGLFKSEFIGFSNFKFFLASPDVLRYTRNTVLLNLMFIFIGTIFTITMSLLLFEIKGKRRIRVHQTTFFVPYLISWVVFAFFTDSLLSTNGVLNNILKSFGGEPIAFYYESKYWPIILLFSNMIKNSGYGMIMYYSVLMGTSPEYYEAADLDGANRFQKMIHISLPFLRKMIAILLIMSFGGIFRSDFGMFYFLPRDYDGVRLAATTQVIDTYIYRATFSQSNFGLSTAIGLFQSAVGCLLLLGANFVIKLVDKESAFI